MISRNFATTAARLAEVWDLADRFRTYAYDNENGRVYRVRSAGAGANTMVAEPEQFGLVVFNLNDFREVDGAADLDVGAIAANGGILASDTTPVLIGDSTESQAISWEASNNDAIGAQKTLPLDFDGSRDVTMMAMIGSGTTNAGSLSVNTYWDKGTVITDTITGPTSATVTACTGTIAAADMPDAPTILTLTIITAAHTTNAVNLNSFALRYYRK